MKYLCYTLLAATITITSCKNDDTAKVQANPVNEIPFWQQTAPVQTAQSEGMQNGNSAAGTVTPAGINPPHGQANHRCDIAVGAPLNATASGATMMQNNALQSTPGITTTAAVTAKTVTAKGMNPPHGESGHRCDISVGAPLNSKPASTTTPTANSTSTEYTVQQPVPALLSTDAAASKTAAGMNPAHGKEGHRCDIAVGDPLPKT